MTRPIRRLVVCLLGLAACAGPARAVEEGRLTDELWKGIDTRKRPNVLLIVADDLGFADIRRWGSEIPTPNIDAIAISGATLTNFYMSPVSSVSRGMFLTGVDSHLIGLGTFAETPHVPHLTQPGYEGPA